MRVLQVLGPRARRNCKGARKSQRHRRGCLQTSEGRGRGRVGTVEIATATAKNQKVVLPQQIQGFCGEPMPMRRGLRRLLRFVVCRCSHPTDLEDANAARLWRIATATAIAKMGTAISLLLTLKLRGSSGGAMQQQQQQL